MKLFWYSIFWRCPFKAFVSSKSSSFLKIFQVLTYQVFPPPCLYFLVHDSFEASDSQPCFLLEAGSEISATLEHCCRHVRFPIKFRYLKNDLFSFMSSLRYSWGGQPLFITCPPANLDQAIPACSTCGSSRVFEFQLMPTLVSMLQSDSGAWLGWINISKVSFLGKCSELQFELFSATNMCLTAVQRICCLHYRFQWPKRELFFVETLCLQLWVVY